MSTTSMIISAPPVVEWKTTNDLPISIDIEIRGYYPHYFFRAEDIEKHFKIEKLIEILLDPENGFERGIHYQEFFVHVFIQNFKRSKKEIYLTHLGFMTVIHGVKTCETEKFQTLASHIMFVHNFGNESEKLLLASRLLHVEPDVVHDMTHKTDLNTTPQAYIILMGVYGYIRKHLKMECKYGEDDMRVVIYGCSDNLNSTLAEYHKRYPFATFDIVATCFVDPMNRSSTERKLKERLSGFSVFENIAVLPRKWNDHALKDLIDDTFKCFSGRITEVVSIMDDFKKQYLQSDEELLKTKEEMTREIEKLKMELSLHQEICNKQLEIERGRSQYKDVVIKQLELEVQNWKLQGQIYEQECLLYENNQDRATIIS